jgi:hypothetical protein
MSVIDEHGTVVMRMSKTVATPVRPVTAADGAGISDARTAGQVEK